MQVKCLVFAGFLVHTVKENHSIPMKMMTCMPEREHLAYHDGSIAAYSELLPCPAQRGLLTSCPGADESLFATLTCKRIAEVHC
jgi:hypothetical protein